MSKDRADQNATAAGQNATAAGVVPGGATPLLRTLGDANAAVCTDGFCEVPQLKEVAPGHKGDDGSHE
jgi:hypothetical protein